MIRCRIYIEDYDIVVYCYFAKTAYFAREIAETMKNIGASERTVNRAYLSLKKGDINTGITYYNPRTKKGVMVTAISSDASEEFNTLLHELRHLTSYIAKYEGLDPFGEDIGYLQGEIARDIFPYIEHLLCDNCRQKEDENYECNRQRR